MSTCFYGKEPTSRKNRILPRALVFGCDERLIASGLDHYLEQPDDAAVSSSGTDPAYRQSMNFRRAAMKAVVELDHSTKWSQAIRQPTRPEVPTASSLGIKSSFGEDKGRARKDDSHVQLPTTGKDLPLLLDTNGTTVRKETAIGSDVQDNAD